MNLRKLLLLLSTLCLASAAHAQVGLYGTVTASRLSNIAYTTPTASSTNAEVNPVGGTIGLYYDFKTFGPVRIGGDLRGTILRTERGAFATANVFGARTESYQGGVRASFHTPITRLHPYVEGAAGLARSNYGIQYNLESNLTYHGYLGADFTIAPLLDLRIFELGAGALSGSNPTSRTYPEESISAGIVLHLPF